MISPVDPRWDELTRAAEAYARGLEELAALAPGNDDGDELRGWLESRQQKIDELNILERKLNTCRETLQAACGWSTWRGDELRRLDPGRAETLEEALASARRSLALLQQQDETRRQELAVEIRRLGGSLDRLQKGRRAMQAYRPVDSGGGRFFDQKK